MLSKKSGSLPSDAVFLANIILCGDLAGGEPRLILSKYASFIEHLLEQGCSVVGCRDFLTTK
jgi:hypothetical protein